MNDVIKNKALPIGRKIERVRKLRGLTQEFVGEGLGITKQAVSKLEQSDIIEDVKLVEIAKILGVTVEGLKNFDEDVVLYNSTIFNEGSSVTNSNINNYVNSFINNPVEKIIELYESLLKSEREKVDILLDKKNKS